jgi:hypothetical protein
VFADVRLQAVGTALTDNAHESISGQKQSAKVEPGSVIDLLNYNPIISVFLWLIGNSLE